MIDLTLNGNILELKETQHRWGDTIINFWYRDLTTWQVSSKGMKNDTPDRDMTPAGIQWMVDHFLPKVMTHDEIKALVKTIPRSRGFIHVMKKK